MSPMIDLLFLITGSLVTFLLMRGEVGRLRQQNADLLGSLYHRIGYKPHEQKAEIAPNLAERVPIKDEFPDLLALQESARNE